MSFTVLVELDVAMEISAGNDSTTTWTADGSNYYYQLGTRAVIDNQRRDIMSVRIGYWELTEAASHKQIIDGSWYEDVANNRLYINTPATYNPANPEPIGRIVLARLKLYFSNYSIDYNGVHYENRILLDPDDVSVRVAVSDELMGGQPASGGKITFANGDGFFDSLLTNYHLLGQRIEIASLSGTTKTVLKTSTVGKITRTDAAVELQLFNKLALLDRPLLKKRFSASSLSDYPDQEQYSALPKDTEGTFQPVIVGCPGIANTGVNYQNFLLSVPTILVDRGTDQGSGTWRASKFKICAKIKNPETGTNHGLTSTITVYKYSAGVVTALTVTTNYTLADSNTEIDMVNSSAGDLLEQDEIRVRCSTGLDSAGIEYADDASDTFTGDTTTGHYIYHFPDIMHFLLVCFAGIKTAQLDLATFTLSGITKQGIVGTFPSTISWAKTATTYALAGYFDSQISIKELVEILCFSNDCIIVEGSDGKLRLQKYTQTTANTDACMVDASIHQYAESKSIDDITNRILVKYGQLPAGSQSTQFTVPLKKRKRKKKVLKWQNITVDVQEFQVKRNGITRPTVEGGNINFFDDLGQAFEVENQTEITTYFIDGNMAQDFADELYWRWGRGFWIAQFVDVDGTLNTKLPSDKIVIYRRRSASGAITAGKAFMFLDGTRQHSNNTVSVLRADELV